MRREETNKFAIAMATVGGLLLAGWIVLALAAYLRPHPTPPPAGSPGRRLPTVTPTPAR